MIASALLKHVVCALCLVGSGLFSASAAVIVDWGNSDNYVTAGVNLALPAAVTSGSTRIYSYSSVTPVSPSSGYTAPAGKSGRFYGGSYVTSSTGAPFWDQARIQGATPDRLQYYEPMTSGVTYSGAAFTAFLKQDFLNGTSSKTIKFALVGGSPVGSLSLTIIGSTLATHRFAILNDGQWYLSSITSTVNGGQTLSLTSAEILASTWGLWNPVDPSNNNRLGVVPTTFNALGSSFTNIQGAGYYVGFAGSTGQSINSSIGAFTMNAVPEPGTTVAFLLGLTAVVLLRRWRKV